MTIKNILLIIVCNLNEALYMYYVGLLIFKSVKSTCKEIKLQEFHFKFLHSIVVLGSFKIPPTLNILILCANYMYFFYFNTQLHVQLVALVRIRDQKSLDPTSALHKQHSHFVCVTSLR